MAADLLDVIDLATAKQAVNMAATANEQNAPLERAVTAISRIIDDVCGPVVRRTVTAELIAGGSRSVWLRQWPATSVTTVREVRTAGTPATVPAAVWGSTTDGYYAVPWRRNPAMLSGKLVRVNGGSDWFWPAGETAVEVTYVAGRYATTATVDTRFIEAAGAILRRLWKRESGIWSQASNVFETPLEAEPTAGFFRVVRPLVHELLRDDIQGTYRVA